MAVRLPRLDSARVFEVEERLRDGFEELQNHRVLELARAFRDGEAVSLPRLLEKASFAGRGYKTKEPGNKKEFNPTTLGTLGTFLNPENAPFFRSSTVISDTKYLLIPNQTPWMKKWIK
jgi:hypothetical protein